jgi:hypothetical protein
MYHQTKNGYDSFSNVSAANLLKIAKFVLYISVRNVAVKSVFSIMKNLWADKRN